MSYSLGTAQGTIEVAYNGRGVDQARDDIRGLKNESQTTEQAFGKLGTGMMVAGGAIAAGLALGVKSAADFEKRLSAIQAVSGATGKEMDAIRAKALELGKSTAFSAGESALAMEELIKAGLPIKDVLNGAADATVNLAAAGEIDLPQAATIAANAMNQFGLSAKDMTGVVDNIAGAANASAIDVSDFGQSLTQVGAVANLAGVSFKDTATAIALMGNAGIKGSDAGTSLKTMFTRLNPSTDKAKNLMKELGIITEDGSNRFYDQQGNLKSLADVSQILQDSLKGMTAQQKQATLSTLFGSDAIRGAAILTKAGSKGFESMAKSMAKVSAAEVAKTRMDNLAGTMEELKGSLETIAISIGTILLPAISKIADATLSAANAFLSLSPATQKIVTIVAAATAGFLLFGGAMIKTVQFARDMADTLRVVKTALLGKAAAENASTAAAIRARAAQAASTATMVATKTATLAVSAATRTWAAVQWLLNAALLANPLVLIAALIAALVVAIVLLWKKSETFRAVVIAVWNAIKAAVSVVVNWFMNTVVPFLKRAWLAIVAGLKAMWQQFKPIWQFIVALVKLYIKIIATVIKTYVKIWTAVFKAAWKVISTVFKVAWKVISAIVKTQIKIITAVIKAAWKVIGPFIKAQMKIITAVVKGAWKVISAVTKATWKVITTGVKVAINVIKTVIQVAFNVIKTLVSTTWNFIKGVFRTATKVIKAVTAGNFNAIPGILRNAMSKLIAGAQAAWARVKSLFSNSLDSIKSMFSNVGSILYNAGRDIIQGLIDGIQSAIGGVADALGSVTSMIPDWKGPPVKDKVLLEQNGELILGGLISGIRNMLGPLRRELEGISDFIPATVENRVVSAPPSKRDVMADVVAATTANGSGATINMTVNNPVGEPTSQSMVKTLDRAAMLGAFDG